ncbi:REP-associated tyrosine transposase [Paramaledivibacter caminithermalis]|uniref:REP element-mobilizing transposase RayT n=1 Tax=Paramaledivibacter caminithermalis (strain DSM 15212 / CIP 107654 / DViRD3) TaxID=1121301 RepID=A0A1M6KEZ9_PARC5|nr:transposase [Paramaledivibacter caminithermalis]SHJ57504.1 REP element-mobilizing transposase RayT [Paramaledivibacter caminithermalis DSM 15212]
MPRRAREKSSTGIYHVILRGINRQRIFEDDEDYEKLLETLKDNKKVSGYKIYAYCFMSNHIHLLIKEGEEDLGTIFRRIGATYVYWYNWKYNRHGHLFQDRYKSEVVENDRYFLTVLRYIHQNPLKAGIVEDISKYPWSSYREYIAKPMICDIEMALSLFTEDRQKAIALFKGFNLEKNNDVCLEYNQNVRLNDEEASEFIKGIAEVKSPLEIQNFKNEKRNKIIKKCKEKGLSIRQIERLTGVSFGVIRRI